MKLRIAVIGAGTTGCGAARRAAELGASDVVIFEKKTPASASSGLSAGVFCVQTLNPLEIELRIRARETVYHLQKNRGLHFARIGAIRFATNDEDAAGLERALHFQRSLGVDDARIVTRDEIKKMVPDVRCDDVVAGLYGPNDGHIDGHTYCAALLEDAKDFGARLRSHTEIIGYRKMSGGHVLKTKDGESEFDIIINAAGAWAGKVGQVLGHPAPVRPEVHEVIIARLPRKLGYVMPLCQLANPEKKSGGVYFRQEGPDTLVTGLHSRGPVPGLEVTDFDSFSPPNSDEYLQAVAEELYQRLPLGDIGVKSGWYGLYPTSADNRFMIGPYKSDPTILVVAGFGGVGVTSGAAGGACAAEWAILGKISSVPSAEVFLPDRATLAGKW
jgi:sarcosine oxidase, subunit beta